MSLIDDFSTFLQSERGASPATVRAYIRDIRTFVAAVASKGIDPGCPQGARSVTAAHVREHASRLFVRSRPATVARALSSLRAYFDFLALRGTVSGNPARAVENPRLPVGLPEHLSVDEVFGLLAAGSDEAPGGSRDRAIVELLYATGLRVSELAALDAADLDFATRALRILGKGGKERLVFFGRKAAEALRGYLGWRLVLLQRRRCEQEPALFVNRLGSRLSDRSVRTLLDRQVRRAAIGRGISPHALRHTFATHLLNAGADLRTIQELLGHASLSTTQRYTHLEFEKLAAVHARCHPLARAGKGDE